MKLKFTSQLSFLSLLAVCFIWLAPSGGQSGNYAGAPGDGGSGFNNTCAQSNGGCHRPGSGTATGSVELLGLPTTYQAGSTYSLTLRLTDANTTSIEGGFQIVATENGDNNIQYGTFSAPEGTRLAGSGRLIQSTPKVMTNGVVDWTFDYTVPASRGGANPENIVFYYVGNAVDGSGTGNDYTRDGLTGVTLPIDLVSFYTKKMEEGQIQLNWITATEINSASFDIEHSTDGTTFKTIGNKTAAGSSFANRAYGYVHSTPATGINYYRLKLIDQDGSFEYSTIQSIHLETSKIDLAIYPNPTANFLNITSLDENLLQVSIVNSMGQELRQIPLIEGANSVQIQDLSAGNYFIKYQSGTSFEMKQFIKL